MEEYKTLYDIESVLDISAGLLYSVSSKTSAHYKKTVIKKKDGGDRVLFVPDGILKTIQKRINERILVHIPVSEYATAYIRGASVKSNAYPHIGKPAVLKLDISHFFDSIMYSQVKEKVFSEKYFSEGNRVLLSVLCYNKECLPQGAPTSPAISNIIMYEFDERMGRWCEKRGITYTRYCDDMTFSGELDRNAVMSKVKRELKRYGLYLNPTKSAYITKNKRQCVTSVVVNDKLSVAKEYRASIRQQIYYCKKFGVDSHITYTSQALDKDKYLQSLLGKINYVISIMPDDKDMIRYREYVMSQINNKNANEC